MKNEKTPSNAPKRLISLWHKLGRSDRQVARERDVNQFYVSQLIRRGIEPDDKTENQQEIRARLFLRRKKPKPRKPVAWNKEKSIIEAMSYMTKQALRWKKSPNHNSKPDMNTEKVP